ncbi:MAG: hypothetical protein KDA25_03750 [Phycisphaerales bacterium]|nr:hypothetical protein [Phycisphaerales bacterium]
MRIRMIHAAMLLALPLVTGCTREATPTQTTTAAAEPTFMLASSPTDPAAGVEDVKRTAKEGDTIVMRGRIGGHREPMSADAAVFIIADLSMPHCGEIEGDTCPRPWDYCCEPRESLMAKTATIQVVDGLGAPYAVDLREMGLAPLDEVIVVGTVGARPSPDVLVIRATGIHRVTG